MLGWGSVGLCHQTQVQIPTLHLPPCGCEVLDVSRPCRGLRTRSRKRRDDPGPPLPVGMGLGTARPHPLPQASFPTVSLPKSPAGTAPHVQEENPLLFTGPSGGHPGTPDFPAQHSCLCVSAEKVPAALAGPMGSPDSASPPSRPRDVLARLRLRPPNAHSLPKNASTTEGGKLLKGRPCPKGQMASPDPPRPPQQSWDQRPGRQCTGVRTA